MLNGRLYANPRTVQPVSDPRISSNIFFSAKKKAMSKRISMSKPKGCGAQNGVTNVWDRICLDWHSLTRIKDLHVSLAKTLAWGPLGVMGKIEQLEKISFPFSRMWPPEFSRSSFFHLAGRNPALATFSPLGLHTHKVLLILVVLLLISASLLLCWSVFGVFPFCPWLDHPRCLWRCFPFVLLSTRASKLTLL